MGGGFGVGKVETESVGSVALTVIETDGIVPELVGSSIMKVPVGGTGSSRLIVPPGSSLVGSSRLMVPEGSSLVGSSRLMVPEGSSLVGSSRVIVPVGGIGSSRVMVPDTSGVPGVGSPGATGSAGAALVAAAKATIDKMVEILILVNNKAIVILL